MPSTSVPLGCSDALPFDTPLSPLLFCSVSVAAPRGNGLIRYHNLICQRFTSRMISCAQRERPTSPNSCWSAIESRRCEGRRFEETIWASGRPGLPMPARYRESMKERKPERQDVGGARAHPHHGCSALLGLRPRAESASRDPPSTLRAAQRRAPRERPMAWAPPGALLPLRRACFLAGRATGRRTQESETQVRDRQLCRSRGGR